MNIKLVSVISALAFSAAVAQDYDDEYAEESSAPATETVQEENEEPVPAPIVPAPAPVVEEPEESVAKTEETEAPASSGSLDVLHGLAYNTVGNEAGASTLRGDMDAPYKMSGRTLAYVEPTNEYGAIALTKGSLTYLLAFDNVSDDVGMFSAGFATKSFGLVLDVALAKHWASTESKTTATSSTADYSMTEDGDYLGLKFAAPLGAMDISANAYWNTYANDFDSKNDGTETNNSKWELGAAVTLTNGPSAKNMFWSAGLDFVRHADNVETKNPAGSADITNPGAYMMMMPRFNLAFPLAQNESARLFAGLNTRLPLVFFDKIENTPAKQDDSYSIIGVYTTPNILAEMSVTENWILFGEVAFDWEVFSYASDELNRDGSTDEMSLISMKTGYTSANAGARFQYKSLVLEASIGSSLNSSSWSGLIGMFSAMFTF